MKVNKKDSEIETFSILKGFVLVVTYVVVCLLCCLFVCLFVCVVAVCDRAAVLLTNYGK